MKVIGVDFSLPVTRPWFFKNEKINCSNHLTGTAGHYSFTFCDDYNDAEIGVKKSVIPRLFRCRGRFI